MQSLPSNETVPGKHKALESINEQLESTIEQLDAARQALLGAQHELHAVTSLMESMHQEIELLSNEVDRLRNGYAGALDHVPYPVLLANREGRVAVWNHAAQEVFNLQGGGLAGMYLYEIPVQPSLRQILTRKHQAVLERGSTLTLKNQLVQVKPALYRMDVHFSSLSDGVLVVFRDGLAGLREQHRINLVGSFAS